MLKKHTPREGLVFLAFETLIPSTIIPTEFPFILEVTFTYNVKSWHFFPLVTCMSRAMLANCVPLMLKKALFGSGLAESASRV